MKILSYGSLNVDYVYHSDHIVREGETLLTSSLEIFCGGKGLNQSIALAKAGLPVYHAGIIGNDGQMLVDELEKYGVDISHIEKQDVRSGHTIIQVDKNGQNCILLYGGTNQMQTKERIDAILADFGEGDYLVLQNEVNLLDYIIDRAYARGMKIVLNPSPYNESLSYCDLKKVFLLMLNEVEGEQMTGSADPDEILARLQEEYPETAFVLTLGVRGAFYCSGTEKVFQDVFPVVAVDTTAAGDTFTGFFLSSLIDGCSSARSLEIAARASSIAVTRPGAAPSVPSKDEVLAALESK